MARRRCCLGFAVFLMLWSGCSAQPLQQRVSFDRPVVRIEKSAVTAPGVVIGVPRGGESAALEYAEALRHRIGAGLVVAHGAKGTQVQVTHPSLPYAPSTEDGSIYPEFQSSLRAAAGGNIRIYIGVSLGDAKPAIDRIEVASTGFSLQQLQALKQSFHRRRAQIDGKSPVMRVELALEPLDTIEWDSAAVRHHGVLLAAERGLSVRLPAPLAKGATKAAYRELLGNWIADAVEIGTKQLAEASTIEVALLPHGKIEIIGAGANAPGVVIGAPHGTFDAYTSGLVREICAETGLAGVVATGFTPTETGDGWRINVNRPSERHPSLVVAEAETGRARRAYEQFKRMVLSAARGPLHLYVDIHQNSGSRIEVATVGISAREARFVKETYRVLRDEALAGRSEIAVVDFAIEPLDRLEVGAWPAKETGILRLAEKSLHFELPGDGLMATEDHRKLYALVLTRLLREIALPLSAEKHRKTVAVR